MWSVPHSNLCELAVTIETENTLITCCLSVGATVSAVLLQEMNPFR